MKIDSTLPAIVLIDNIDDLKKIHEAYHFLKKTCELLAKNRKSYCIIVPSNECIAKSATFELKKFDMTDSLLDNCSIVYNNLTILLSFDVSLSLLYVNVFQDQLHHNRIICSFAINTSNQNVIRTKASDGGHIKEVLQLINYMMNTYSGYTQLAHGSKTNFNGVVLKNISKREILLAE